MFGEIQYFLEIENFFYAAIKVFKKISDCVLKEITTKLPKTLENYKKVGYFSKKFFSCEKTNEIILINAKSIKNKCIIYEEFQNVFSVSEFFSESEHDLKCWSYFNMNFKIKYFK